MFYRKMVRINFIGLLLVAGFLISSCRQIDLHESHVRIKNFQWHAASAVHGQFNITDTNKLYRLFVIIRHEDAYRYNNIWLNIGLQAPSDSMRYQRVEVPLGSDATGWFGAGMNNIWEIRHQLTRGPQKFAKSGVYKYSIGQVMRDDPLEHILSAGLRVEAYE